MKLTINGEVKIVESSSDLINLEEVIKNLGHHPQGIVVEFNGVIINRKKWFSQLVKDGDKLEIVTIVGGGS